MLDIFGEDRVEFEELVRQEMVDIQQVVKEAAALLNSLSPEGAIAAHTWLGGELIHSLIKDEEAAVEMSKHMQRWTENELRSASKQQPN